MTSKIELSKDDAFVIEGKMALPYQYFAGRTGSRFLIALRDEKKILGIKCPGCNKVNVPPRSSCEHSVTDKCTEWVELPGTGTVTGFTVIRYEEPYQPAKPPYILAMIRLDHADGGLVHIVKGMEPEKMTVGLKVRAVFANKPTNTIMDLAHFEEDRGGGAARASIPYKLGYTYDELEVGMSATFTKTITETDVYLFAGISGDFNPMHVDEEFAKLTPFGTRIAHGALPQALIAPVLGMKLPGLGTVAIEVTARFRAPTHFGDTITAKATVVEKLEAKRRVRMDLLWTNQNGTVVAKGSAVVIPPPKM